jgi:two-component system nitrogen regulation response regulator GlnG
MGIRLRVWPIETGMTASPRSAPALLTRRADIGPLLCHFGRQELEAVGEAHRQAPPDAYAKAWLPVALAGSLVRRDWPGTCASSATSRGSSSSPAAARRRCAPSSASRVTSVPRHARRRRRRAGRRRSATTSSSTRGAPAHGAAVGGRLPAHPAPVDRRRHRQDPSPRTAGDIGADEIEACFRACGGDLEAMVAHLQVSRRALGRGRKELGLR